MARNYKKLYDEKHREMERLTDEVHRRGTRIGELLDEVISANGQISTLHEKLRRERKSTIGLIKENVRMRWYLEMAYAEAERSKSEKYTASLMGADTPVSGLPSRGNQRSGTYPVREYDI